jgi:hypothetical protein
MKELIKAEQAAVRLNCPSKFMLNQLNLMTKEDISHMVNSVLLNATNKPLSFLDDTITVLTYIHNFR